MQYSKEDQSNRRFQSLDFFRGILIFLIIFFNYLMFFKGAPFLLVHAPSTLNMVTIPDVIYICFPLCIGLSLGLHVRKILTLQHWKEKIWYRILILYLVGAIEVLRYIKIPFPEHLHHFGYFSVLLLIIFSLNYFFNFPYKKYAALVLLLIINIYFYLKFPYLNIENMYLTSVLGILATASLMCSIFVLVTNNSTTKLYILFFLLLSLDIFNDLKVMDTYSQLCDQYYLNYFLGKRVLLSFAGLLITRFWAENKKIDKHNALVILAALFFIGTSLIVNINVNKLSGLSGFTLLGGGFSLLLYLAITLLSQKMKHTPIYKGVISLGQNSFLFYIVHFLMWDFLEMTKLNSIVWPLVKFEGYFIVFNSFIVSAFISTCFIYLLKKYSWLKLNY